MRINFVRETVLIINFPLHLGEAREKEACNGITTITHSVKEKI